MIKSNTTKHKELLDEQLVAAFAELERAESAAKPPAESPTESTTTINTYCRYSGTHLQVTSALFQNERPIHFAKHWLFSQTSSTILHYHFEQRSKTSKQQWLLVLSLALTPNCLRSKLQLNHPMAIDPPVLFRQYGQAMLVLKRITELAPANRARLLQKIPMFRTDALMRSNGITRATLLTAGAEFLNYLTNTVYAHLLVITNVEFSKSDLEIELAARLTALESAANTTANTAASSLKVAPLTSTEWNFILLDIESSFDLPEQFTAEYRKQLKKPTSISTLTELAKLIKGLLQFTSTSTESLSIPALQFKFALIEVSELITKLEQSSMLQLLATELPDAESTTDQLTADTKSAKPELVIIPLGTFTEPTTTTTTNIPTNSASQKLAALRNKMAARSTNRATKLAGHLEQLAALTSKQSIKQDTTKND